MFTPSEGADAVVAAVSAVTSQPMLAVVGTLPLPTSVRRRPDFTGERNNHYCFSTVGQCFIGGTHTSDRKTLFCSLIFSQALELRLFLG